MAFSPAIVVTFLLLLASGGLTRGWKYDTHQPQFEAWNEELGLTKMPKYLGLRVSNMNRESTHKFSQEIDDRTLSSDHVFCTTELFFCNSGVQLPNVTISPTFKNSILLTHHYFKKSDVLVGQRIPIPHLQNDVPFKPFLPLSLAKKLPLDSHFLPVLLSMLNIPSKSHLANYMQETITKCEKQASHEKHGLLNHFKFWHKSSKALCVSTFEELVHFVSQNLGPELEILQPTRFSLSEQNMTVKSLAVVGSPKSHKSVVCTDTIFPFSVFDCRVDENVENIEVTLESDDNHIYFAIMQCTKVKWHLFNRHFLIHKGTEDEDGKLCHWMTDNDLVFVKKDRAMEKVEEKKEKEEEKEGQEKVEEEDENMVEKDEKTVEEDEKKEQEEEKEEEDDALENEEDGEDEVKP